MAVDLVTLGDQRVEFRLLARASSLSSAANWRFLTDGVIFGRLDGLALGRDVLGDLVDPALLLGDRDVGSLRSATSALCAAVVVGACVLRCRRGRLPAYSTSARLMGLDLVGQPGHLDLGRASPRSISSSFARAMTSLKSSSTTCLPLGSSSGSNMRVRQFVGRVDALACSVIGDDPVDLVADDRRTTQAFALLAGT